MHVKYFIRERLPILVILLNVCLRIARVMYYKLGDSTETATVYCQRWT